MSPPVLLRSPPVKAREPLLRKDRSEVPVWNRAGEVAGGAAAECTAVVCCFPCAVMDMVVLTVYKVPAGLCRKAIDKRKGKPSPRRMNHEQVLLKERNTTCSNCDSAMSKEAEGVSLMESSEFDKELWAKFRGTGFWRSPSTESRIQNGEYH